MPYEDAAKLLDAAEYFAVSTCPCRHRKNMDPSFADCKYPSEVCIHLDRLGRYTVENEMGRQIDRQEAEDLLRRCAEDGLVHGISNHQEGVDTICNCCKCCCIWFEAFHKLKHAMSLSPSNYRVRANPEACIGCGLCVKRCHMDALRLETCPDAKGRITRVAAKNGEGLVELTNKTGKVAALDPELCIGCGVCAYKCRSRSLVLEPREVIEDPPLNLREYGMRLFADFAEAAARAAQKK
jgi:ferredoxin